MAVTQLNTKADFDKEIASGTTFVDFYATWCGPCKAIAPMVEKLSDQFTTIKFFKLDVDEVSEVAASEGISAMPTLVLYKDGKAVETVVGANIQKIKSVLEANA
ncbi:hypothetical protein TRICI_004643 [Trichomonascus ciferrii]|uniref:Thioredoxin n=1 Tax=Trichomonascus ciferrii TaxID=44093 RepID=A0A642V0D7_9ASCO|nr:hypothetical protein TRICI_004643 [Trichomonascus ciferrii]